jgi:endonuclease/exonuclease/phosphatase family metal-dependent hydrolase
MEAASTHRAFSPVRNAILIRPPWRLAPGSPIVRELTRRERTSRRGLVAAGLRSGGTRVTAISVHLGLAPRERERHARELTDFVAGIHGPVIVGADLNEGPEGPSARWTSDRLFDLFGSAGESPGDTFPARAPTARIDYLFAGPEVTATRVWVARTPAAARASDHLPVIADVELAGP